MDLSSKIFLAFWGFQFIKVIGMVSGFLTRREVLSLSVITSGLGLVGTVVYEILRGLDWQEGFVVMWAVLFYLDYKNWKKHKDDDDNDHRKKRWVRLRNKLPKPKVKTLAQPT